MPGAGPILWRRFTRRLKRTTVLLPNANVTRYVGGYVSLFPHMAVFNSMPAQGFWGTNDWLNTLAGRRGPSSGADRQDESLLRQTGEHAVRRVGTGPRSSVGRCQTGVSTATRA